MPMRRGAGNSWASSRLSPRQTLTSARAAASARRAPMSGPAFSHPEERHDSVATVNWLAELLSRAACDGRPHHPGSSVTVQQERTARRREACSSAKPGEAAQIGEQDGHFFVPGRFCSSGLTVTGARAGAGAQGTTVTSPRGRSWQASRTFGGAPTRRSTRASSEPGGARPSRPCTMRTRQVEQRPRPPPDRGVRDAGAAARPSDREARRDVNDAAAGIGDADRPPPGDERPHRAPEEHGAQRDSRTAFTKVPWTRARAARSGGPARAVRVRSVSATPSRLGREPCRFAPSPRRSRGGPAPASSRGGAEKSEGSADAAYAAVNGARKMQASAQPWSPPGPG